MRNLSISYTNVCGECKVCGVKWGGVGARSLLGRRKGRGLGLFRDRVKVRAMSTYSYVRSGLHIDTYNGI